MLPGEHGEKRSPAAAPWSLGSGLGPISRDDARFLGFPEATLNTLNKHSAPVVSC